jgi:predicted nuclease with RNAse H fold
MTSKKSFVKKWVERCFSLNDFIIESGYGTIEIFPFATRKILFPKLVGKKQQTAFRNKLQSCLCNFGITLPARPKEYSHDELDAVLAAITVLLHAQHKSELLGDDLDGYIIIPQSGLSHISDSRI